MQPSRKFAFDVGITFLASVVSLSLGFVVTILLGRYLGAGDLGLFRMTSTIYGIAMLVAAIGIPAAMIKYVAEFKFSITYPIHPRTTKIVKHRLVGASLRAHSSTPHSSVAFCGSF